MAATLRRVLVCPPEAAGWSDAARTARFQDLAYVRRPDFTAASAQHQALRRELESAGAEVLSLPPAEDLSLDAVYAHDASFPTDHGVIRLRMGKPARSSEPVRQAEFFRNLGIPLLGALEPPATAEGGDMVWLDATTVMVGRGYRTNRAGIEQLGALLGERGVEVLSAPLPHGQGPEFCLHLMSLLSIVSDRDPRLALVDLPLLAVETVDLLRERGFRLLPIDPAERGSMAVNVLALGNRRLLALAENERTNARLRAEDFEVRSFPGGEICQNGSGGPTCLTRPLLRG
jgi:N-dimethylarginine dimethylaminohydrolase